mgnify:CR=1 FL=1
MACGNIAYILLFEILITLLKNSDYNLSYVMKIHQPNLPTFVIKLTTEISVIVSFNCKYLGQANFVDLKIEFPLSANSCFTNCPLLCSEIVPNIKNIRLQRCTAY